MDHQVEVSSYEDSAGEFSCVGSIFSVKLLRFRSVNTEKAAGNIFLH